MCFCPISHYQSNNKKYLGHDKYICYRLHKRRTKSKEEKERKNLKNQINGTVEDKENFAEACEDKSLKSKFIDVDTEIPEGRDHNAELSDIRREVEEQYLENLKCRAEDDKDSVASGGSATPNTARRRKIIDRNVKVSGPGNLNASSLLQECEDEFPRLNYSYSNVSLLSSILILLNAWQRFRSEFLDRYRPM